VRLLLTVKTISPSELNALQPSVSISDQIAEANLRTLRQHDPAELERRVTPRTRAIIVVHLYGLSADMDPILAFAKARKLPVIEDNAQAIGASYKGRPTGSLADAGCLSFYPTKNLGAYGDADRQLQQGQRVEDCMRGKGYTLKSG